MASTDPSPAPLPSSIDQSLITAARSALLNVPPNTHEHVVAAAARSKSGEVFVGINITHFNGGPCAELVVLGAAAAKGVLAEDLDVMVAVRKARGSEEIKVLNPCGRCRQVMMDYNKDINVIVRDEQGEERLVGVRDLLPLAYVYGE